MVVRRCPTLPHPPGCSTIGAVGLSFRVRNGTGRFPHAITTVTLAHQPEPGVLEGETYAGHDTWKPYEAYQGVCGPVFYYVWTRPAPPSVGGVWVLLLEPYSRREHACNSCGSWTLLLCTHAVFAPSLVVVGRGGPFAAHQHTPPPGRPGVVGCG